jgi:heptose I phosphotransferase
MEPEVMDICDDLQGLFKGRDAFDRILNVKGEVYREHKNRKTLRFLYKGSGYFIKIHRRVGWREIIKNLAQFRLPVISACNELNAIERLVEVGVKTPEIAGFGVRGSRPAWLDSFIITKELENTVSLEDFTSDWGSDPPDFSLKLSVTLKIADIARRLHRNGMNHRDFYICHFLINTAAINQKGISDSLQIYLIDLHRVQLRKMTPRRWIIKDLSGLFFSTMNSGLRRRDYFRFMKAYGRKSLRDLLKEDIHFWNQVNKRAVKLYKKHFKRPPESPFAVS